MWLRAPLFSGLDVARVRELSPPNMNVQWLRRLRDRVRGKLIVKGIVTGEDAALALQQALALGATAVGIGRPQGWGVAAFGQKGVEAVIDIYARELQAIMRQAGTPRLADIGPNAVLHRRI